MRFHSTSPDFKRNAARALGDAQLQKALGNVKQGFIDKRQKATERLPEFEALRELGARHQKPHPAASRPLSRGLRGEGRRHPAGTCISPETPRRRATSSCRSADAGARTVTKGKSMISEEIGINEHLESTASRRSRPISANTSSSSPRAAQPHHRAGGAPQRDAGRAGFPPRPHASRSEARPLRTGAIADRGAQRAARAVSRGRRRHHRRAISSSPKPAPR